MDLKQIQALSEQDMNQVNQLIQKQLHSDVALINQLGFYIVNSGGKRLRPLLTVLSARALGYSGEQHITLATIVEFIHTATLLHDDVVDASELRRGRETANALFGNEASVLVGDFLYTRSFQLMVSLQKMPIMQILADATNVIAEGEVLQLMNCNDPDTTEASYMQVIYCKTAKLFEAATRLAAIINESSDEVIQSMQDYGMYLGTAFQLVDDALDYTAASEELGKNAGDDLDEGKPTLPLLHLMSHGAPEMQTLVREVIEQGGGRNHLEQILAAMEETGSIKYTMQRAIEEANKAKQAIAFLPESDYKQALLSLADIAVERSH